MPSCALDPTAVREQYARYRRLAAAMTCLERTPETISVQFDELLDRDLLSTTLAVERACCPFFVFDFSDYDRRLRIGVRQPQQSRALDAMAAAFTRG
ncbi:MAG: hypothetical protein ACJ76X_05925 [Solirubrobacteraceae bacterium]